MRFLSRGCGLRASRKRQTRSKQNERKEARRARRKEGAKEGRRAQRKTERACHTQEGGGEKERRKEARRTEDGGRKEEGREEGGKGRRTIFLDESLLELGERVVGVWPDHDVDGFCGVCAEPCLRKECQRCIEKIRRIQRPER